MAQGTAENLQQEQTDVESLAETLTSFGNSSITEYPNFNSEIDGEDDINFAVERLIESQFSQKGKLLTPDKVQEWVNTTEDETQPVLVLDYSNSNENGHTFNPEEVEKLAAVLVDALKNEPFNASAWADAEIEQQVPCGNFKSNFFKEARERPVLTLMNAVKTYCSQNDNKSNHIYYKILECATKNLRAQEGKGSDSESAEKRKPVDLDTLKNFPGYYSELRLKFVKLPNKKRPLVRAVEAYVTDEIIKSAQANSAILFTQYAWIPEIIKRCNDEKGLEFSPDQLAKYGIILQKAVHSEMVARCLDFLEHVGISLIHYDENEEEKLNLSSNNSQLSVSLSQGTSSQESQSDINCSQNSHLSMSRDSDIVEHRPASQSSGNLVLVDAIYAAQMQNNPDLEVLRARFEDSDNSPGNSQQSGSSYESRSLSPPQYSIPELEPTGAADHIQDEIPNELEEYGDLRVELLTYASNVSGASQSSLESEEPRRQRRRLE